MKNYEKLTGLLEILKWRRDVRHFRPDALEPGLIERLIAVAQHAPSVGYSQPWRFVEVVTPGLRRQLQEKFEEANEAAARAYPEDEAAEYRRLKLAGLEVAPVVLAVFCDHGTEVGRGLGRQSMPEMLAYSVVMAIHTFWLAATAAGIGVGWVSIVDPAAVCELFEVPAEWGLMGVLCVGREQERSLQPELARQNWAARDERAAQFWRR